MSETPFEISTTLNATAHMLEEAKPPYTDTTAVAPSTQLENIRGYDVEMDFLKSIFLQFKRPHVLEYSYEPFSFHTDHEDQLETLREWADLFPRSVFYALPLVPDEERLSTTLRRTLFVNVDCLKEDTSRVRVQTERKATKSRDNPRISEVKAKVRLGDWYPLHENRHCWFIWDQFANGVESKTSGLEPWIEQEYADREWVPVGMTLIEQGGEPAYYPGEEDRMSVQTKMGEVVHEKELTFWERGLEAGMFGQR